MTQDSRSLDDLHPIVRAKCEAHMKACAEAGIPIRITFTFRSLETQDALYAKGRTKPGKVVTNARAGYSYHNYGLAYDAVPEKLLSLPSWGDTPKHQAETNRIWALYGRLGEAQGLEWGGRFRSITDRPHMQWSGGLTLADLRQGRMPPAETRLA